MSDRIELLPYDPGWPAAYEAERRAVAAALGPDAQDLAFEHVGSTAVPGLMAKPTIDLLVGAPRPGVEPRAAAALEKLGYRHMGEHGIAGRQFFRKGLPPTHHLHWVERGSPFWRRLLVFRDHLRGHPEDCALYESVKSGLAAQYSRERERYTAGKDAVCAEILARAEALSGARRIVVDLEATCWTEGTNVDRQEVIELGACELLPDLSLGRSFSLFVRPEREPVLSEFCTRLTSITQKDVDGAEPFPRALERFMSWIGDGSLELCTWGVYDLTQLRVECARRAAPLPAALERHVDVRALEARRCAKPPATLAEALARCGLSFEGRPHRGVDDARNTARLLARLLGA